MVFITDISFSDPQLWVVTGIILVVATFILIYMKVFAGETRPQR